MIYLQKGQKLFDNEGMIVYDQTGYYNDGDSVICSSVVVPDEPVCRYEAKFIAYGGMVYNISDPDELIKEITKIDPNNLYGKDTKQVAVDKMVENIVPQKSEDLNIDESKNIIDETNATSTPTITPPDELSTTTPQIINTPDDTSTTTPSVIPPIDTSTSTPSVISTTTPQIINTPDDTSTTTPSVIPPIDVSTTTPTITPPDELSTTTPQTINTPNDTSTTTPSVIPPIDVSTTTPASSNDIPPVLDTPVDQTSTSSEIVAFAKSLVKKKISKGLGL